MRMNKLFLLASVLIIFITSCNKDAELIDENGSNNELLFQKIDSLKLKTSTVLDNTVNGTNLTNILLGATQDPRFGFSKAAFYTEFSLSKNAFALGSNAVLDSIVLVLNQTSSYGSLNALYDLNVYELNQTLDPNANYENNTVLNLKGAALASVNNYKFKSGNGSLRIKLNDTFGNSLKNKFGTQTMESSDNLKAFFKGVYVTANASNGDGFVTLALKNDNTKLQMYFHSDTYSDTSFVFNVATKDITLNQYSNNTAGSEAATAISDNNKDESFSYVSSMSGVKTLVSFPDMAFLNKAIINKAEISFYQADYSNSLNTSFPEMENMFLFVNLKDTTLSFLPDFSISNPGPFGGAKKLVVVNGQNTYKYTFNITKYVQDLIKGTAKGETLYLNNISNNQGGRIKIGGGANSALPVKLEILYTIKK